MSALLKGISTETSKGIGRGRESFTFLSRNIGLLPGSRDLPIHGVVLNSSL